MPETNERRYAMPTPLASRFVRLLVGFLVAVPIGLAPVLGKIAGVDALINLFPLSSRGGLIVFATFLLGATAAVLQFVAGEEPSRPVIRKYFRVVVISLIVSFALLFVFYSLVIEVVPVRGGEGTVAVIVGTSRIVGPPCGCPPTDNAKLCIQKLGVGDEAAIETCWDSGSIKISRILLHASYLVVMVSIGGLIGVLLLQGGARGRTGTPDADLPEPADLRAP